MKRKSIYYLLCLMILNISLSSCFDEKDFAFDRLAETTINPNVHLNNLLSTEVTMSDFFSMDSIADTISGLELVTVNDPNGNYLDFVFSIDTIFKPDVPELDPINGINFDLPPISLGDINGSFYGEFNYPDISEPMEVVSTEIPPLDDSQTIDSIRFKKGSLVIALSSDLNHSGFITLKCNGLKNKVTHEIFNQKLRLSNANQVGNKVFNYNVDLTQYNVEVDANSKLNFEYRMFVEVNGTVKPNYDINVNIEFSKLEVDYIYGKLGNFSSQFSDFTNIDVFSDSTFSKIFQGGHFLLEDMYLDFYAETNSGIPSTLSLSTIRAYDENNNHIDLITNPAERTININPASEPYGIGTSSQRINLNTGVINLPPSRIEYLGDLVLNPNHITGFEPIDPWIKIKSKLHIPVKAQMNDLIYDVDVDKIDLGDATDYINSASLKLNLTNYFPFSIEAELYCLDQSGNETGQVLNVESENSENIIVSGANVDANGNIISPSSKTTSISITSENFNLLKNASKMKLKLKLNTSSSGTNKPFIKLNNDSKVTISLGIDIKGQITL